MFTLIEQLRAARFRTIRLALAAAVITIVAAIAVMPAGAGSGDTPGNPPSNASTPADKVPGPAGTGKPIPGQYIVTLKEGENPRAVAAIVGASPKWVYEAAVNGFTAELNSGQLRALQHLRAVENIEQDQEISLDAWYTQTTDISGQPWGLDRIDQRSGLSRSFTYWLSGTYGGGYGVNAYVIDSGIATANPDFGGRARMVYDAFGGNGQDCLGHGTHVAGTIGGTTYGVAKRVNLLGVRVIDCYDRFPSGGVGSVVAAVDWVMRNARKPAVANMSFHVGSVSSTLNQATTNLVNSGVFVAVAAANDARDACYDSPSSAPGTVTVAASDSTDTRASFSDYGACVDLYAPGVNIRSTGLNGTTYLNSGTSMASPHVAGVAALLKSDYGDQTSSTIASWILNATTTNAVKSNISGTPNRLLYMSGW
jgi:subtilisin family serine protease